MVRTIKYNTLWRTTLVIFLLMLSMPLVAEENERERAEQLNKQVDVLMARLQATRDTFTYFSTLRQTVETALLCDYYDGMPNARGKISTKYRHGNSKRLAPLRVKLIDAGMYFYGHQRAKEALGILKTYLKLSESHLFKGEKDLYKGQVAYYMSLLYYGSKSYAQADHYADIALKDTEYASDAAEMKVNCMKEMMVTPNDSARYLFVLLELHDKAPRNSNYLRQLLEYFSSPGREQELEQFAKDETQKYPEDKHAWVLLGETMMRKKDWINAANAYSNAIKLDTTFVEAIYNEGICLSAQAQQGLQNTKPKTSALPDSIVKLLQEAQDDFERVSSHDPQRKEMDWATPLYLVYKLLGNTKKAEALAPEVEKQKEKKS